MKTKQKNKLAPPPPRTTTPAQANPLKKGRREPDQDPKETLLESVPESERWDPVPGSPGYKARVAPSEDEDDEGRSAPERLVEEGIDDAERDQMRQAARNRKE